jgi:hypothetical protein
MSSMSHLYMLINMCAFQSRSVAPNLSELGILIHDYSLGGGPKLIIINYTIIYQWKQYMTTLHTL